MTPKDTDIIKAIEEISTGTTRQIFDVMVKHGTIEDNAQSKQKLSDKLGSLVRYRIVTFTMIYNRRYYHMIGTDAQPVIVGFSMRRISDFIDTLAPGTEITPAQASQVGGCSLKWARRILNSLDKVVKVGGVSHIPRKYYAGATA